MYKNIKNVNKLNIKYKKGRIKKIYGGMIKIRDFIIQIWMKM